MTLGGVNFNRDHGFTNVIGLPTDFEDDFKVWRYLSLPKYLKLLEDNYLYLAKLSEFEDPFEGSLPKTHPDSIEHFKKVYNIPGNVVDGLNEKLLQVRNYTYINCWHINDYESAAMWSLYSKTNESIAIQSTFLKLHEEVNNQAQISAVGYIDYSKDHIPSGNMVYHCLFKRKSYSHEKEFRIIEYDMPSHLNDDEPSSFRQVNVNLDNLIENVYISPKAPVYFQDLIHSISQMYGHTYTIKKSSIDSSPFY